MKNLLIRYRNVVLAGIMLLGFILRFYQLGSNPPSLNWDEASTGYNAYSILKTGHDEYGNFLPLSIRSFDDYKPPLYTYIDIPFVAVFGLNEFAVRLPSAILGSLTILVMYLLILELFSQKKKEDGIFSSWDLRTRAALIGTFLFAISPWSLQLSRAAYEGNIGLFFLLGGLLFMLVSVRKHSYLFISSLFFLLSVYSYHSFRLITPLLIIITALLFHKDFLKFKKIAITALFIFLLLAIPVFSSLVSSNGTGSRLSMVTVFGIPSTLDHPIQELEYDKAHGDFLGVIIHNRRIVYFLTIAKGYFDHYSPDFLFFNGDAGHQHHAVDMGMLFLFELPLILFGFLYLTRRVNKRIFLLFCLLIIAPLPSAITTGTPHPVRAIAMLPVFEILSVVGIVWIMQKISSIQYSKFNIRLKYLIFCSIILFFIFNLLYYFHQYYVHTPIEYASNWQYGYKEAFKIANLHDKDVDKIVMTSKYDQPYIYYLFYNKIDPSWYQRNWNFTGDGKMPRFERKIGKYEFRFIKLGDEAKTPNVLIIGTPDEIQTNAILPKGTARLKSVYYPDGAEAFRIIQTRYVPKI